MATINVASYEEAVEQLRLQAEDYANRLEESREKELLFQADLLEEWLKDAQRGSCPVSLMDFGIVVEDRALTPVKAATEIPATQTELTAVDGAGLQTKEIEVVEASPEIVMLSPVTEEPEQLETPHAEGVEENPEHLSFQRQIEQAEALWQQGNVAEAYPLLGSLRQQPGLSQQQKDTLEDLFQQAHDRFESLLGDAMSAGDAAWEARNIEEALKQYRIAENLAPMDDRVRKALARLGQVELQELSTQDMNRLRAGLRQRSDLKQLGDAVYEAEALEAEGRLTDELARLAREARQAYDALRAAQGVETTMMRFGDLKARKTARDQIAYRVATGETQILDITINRMRPAAEVLAEADKLLEERSADTAQHELSQAKKAIEWGNPVGALRRLQEILAVDTAVVLEDREGFRVTRRLDELPSEERPKIDPRKLVQEPRLPFFDFHRRQLEEKLHEVEVLVADQQAARELLDAADKTDDPIKQLQLIIDARERYSLKGIDERLRRTRQRVLDLLSKQMEIHLSQARNKLSIGLYQEGRDEVAEAEKLPSLWPEETRPDRLQTLLDECADLRQQINTREQLAYQFDKKTAEIKERILDPARRRSGFDMLAQLLEDGQYAVFEDQRKRFNADMDPYRDAGDQLAEAQIARNQRDWQRVRDLTQKLLKAGAGDLQAQIKTLDAEAGLELTIAEAETHLSRDEIPEADKLLQGLLNQTKQEEKDKLRERLRAQLGIIEQARQDTQTTEPGGISLARLYQDAQDLRLRQGVNERLRALNMLRLVGGLGTVEFETVGVGSTSPIRGQQAALKWPAYHLNWHTAEARSQVRELSKKLREEILPILKGAYEARASKPPDSEQLRLWADYATAFRKGRLLEADHERTVARWLEVTQRCREAEAKERMQDWQSAVNIYEELDLHYPRMPEVETPLQRALIQLSIQRADRLRQQDQTEEALKILQQAQEDSRLSGAWELSLALADIHAQRGNFVQAEDAVRHAGQLLERMLLPAEEHETAREIINKKQRALEYEQLVQNALAQAENPDSYSTPRDILLELNEALEKLKEKGLQLSRRLQRKQQEVFNKAEADLLKQARDAKAQKSEDGRIRAVLALVDLKDLETVFFSQTNGATSEQKRRSAEELEPLRNELEPVAESIITRARGFEQAIIGSSLPQALQMAQELLNRLAGFKDVILIFQELGTQDKELREQQKKLEESYRALKDLDDLLKAASEPELWDEAVRLNNFETLEQFNNRLKASKYASMLEVRQYGSRLREWRAIVVYLWQVIAEVKKECIGEENFTKALIALRKSKTRPDFVPDGGAPWTQVQQAGYTAIRGKMNDKMRVADVYGSGHEVVGWQEVEELTVVRATELTAWETWEQEYSRLMNVVSRAYNETQEDTEATQAVIRRQHWQALKVSAEEVQELLQNGPQRESEEPVPACSGKAQKIEEQGQAALALVEEWLTEANYQITLLEQGEDFPTSDEFNKAWQIQDLGRIRELIARAHRVGTTDPQQQKLIEAQERTLKRQEEKQANQGFWRRLFGRS